MRIWTGKDLSSGSHLRFFFVFFALAGILASGSDAWAGHWEVQKLGPGNLEGTTRVRVDAFADLDGQCPGYDCAFSTGAQVTTITPAPPVQSLDCAVDNFIDESGLHLQFLCSEGDGSYSWEMDLETGIAYEFHDGTTIATWETMELYGSCGGMCTKRDEVFTPLQYTPGAVPLDTTTWTVLKERFDS